ncbi:MAG: hypothetical protein HFJ20_00015 [Clostridia bacterium]|nr:hypothetical protein [Clostridia bacterium]HBC85005.1 hypothetical protein [Clostridiales bacterium]
MSELQKEILNMVIVFNNDTLLSVKPLLEKLLDSEILRIDSNANLKEMDIYDKIDVLKSIRILNTDSLNISYKDAINELGLDGDEI